MRSGSFSENKVNLSNSPASSVLQNCSLLGQQGGVGIPELFLPWDVAGSWAGTDNIFSVEGN